MKHLQQLSVKTKVFDRRRTFITHTALNVERSGKASTSVANTYSEQECVNSNNIDVEADDCGMSICGAHQAPGDEDSANTKRNISLFCNWEKLRPRILRTFLDKNSLNDDQICVLCLVQPASIQCSYCRPRQQLCETCAYSLHEKRNQFHVMEKWTVCETSYNFNLIQIFTLFCTYSICVSLLRYKNNTIHQGPSLKSFILRRKDHFHQRIFRRNVENVRR